MGQYMLVENFCSDVVSGFQMVNKRSWSYLMATGVMHTRKTRASALCFGAGVSVTADV